MYSSEDEYDYFTSDSSDSELDFPQPERCCKKCRGCSLNLERIKYYKDKQNSGIYHYAINPRFGDFLLWRTKMPCKVFSELESKMPVDSGARSDPRVLACADMYTNNICIETSVPPFSVYVSKYNGNEFIDYEIKQKVNDLRVALDKNREITSDAKKLVSALSKKITDEDSRVLIQHLSKMLNTMSFV
jgi:hypothetical protein